MPELYKRPDGRSPYWQYDMVMPDGTRKRCSTRQKDKPKAHKAMMATYMAAEAAAAAPKASPTLHSAIMTYVESLESEGKVWAKSVRLIMAKLFGLEQFADRGRYRLPMDLRVTEITEATLRQLKARRLAEGSAMATIGHEIRVIRAATFMSGTRLAIKWAIPVSVNKTRWLSPEEWRLVYDQLDPNRPVGRRGTEDRFEPSEHLRDEREQTRDLFVALSMCGGRWSEVTSLTTDTVLPGGRVKLYGRKTGRERIVPMPAIAAAAMDRRIAAAEGVYLFPSNGAAAADFQRGSGAIYRAIERSGVNAAHRVERDGRVTIHSLRHTFASWCLQAGMTIPEVQELLGHGSITMTMRYAHLAAGVTVDRASAVMTAVTNQVFAGV